MEDPFKWAAQKIFRERRRQANKRGLPFDITLEYILSLPHDICPILGTPLIWSGGAFSPHTGSLDKVIGNKGYVPGNVVWMSLRANLLKRDATQEEVKLIHEWFEKQLPETSLL